MTIKKLTLAAAIAVGIATCSFSSAMAACPCSQQAAPVVSGNSCSTCQKIVTPETAKCPICGNDKSTCGCKKSSCGCEEQPSCDKPAQPASASCPSTSCSDLDMKQVYAYPNAIYGDNNYVGEQKNAIYSTETAWALDGASFASRPGVSVASDSQLTGAAAPVSSGCGCNTQLPVITGGAAPCGCQSDIKGVDVSRDCCKMDNAGCPIEIQSSNSMEVVKKSFVPFQASGITGAAAPLVNIFPDVPDGYWAGCDIDRLASTNVIAGYPDRTFKPGLPISRAEFASMIVKGFNLNTEGLTAKNQFSDVSTCNWANPVISKAVDSGIMSGYCGGKFMPNKPVTRAEALTAMSHGINCPDMDSCKAKSILSQYCDGDKVPSWAEIPVAKILASGALKGTPAPNQISPNSDASRADVASMLQSTRIAGGYDKTPVASDCGCSKKTAYMENEEVVQIPTLQVEFLDEINAKSSHVGQQFAAKTTEEITVNGKTYACGSRVNGKIVEIIRPSGCNKGALKLAFTNIQDCDGCKANLPRQILTAQINCGKHQNPVARFVSMPFTLVGGLLGTTGRTIGGMISNAGNAAEDITNGTGIALGETFQGQFKAAGRSLQDAGKAAIVAPVDFSRTALSGTIGLFQSTGDEVAYLVDPKGSKISAVNPKEHVTIAFGCSN